MPGDLRRGLVRLVLAQSREADRAPADRHPGGHAGGRQHLTAGQEIARIPVTATRLVHANGPVTTTGPVFG